MPLLAKVAEEGGWEAGIGDPTLFGWLAVLAYFAAAYLAYRAGKTERQLQPRSTEMGWSQLAREALAGIRTVAKDPAGIFKKPSTLNYASSNSGPLLPAFWFAL